MTLIPRKLSWIILFVNLLGLGLASHFLDCFFYEILHHKAYEAASVGRPEVAMATIFIHSVFWIIAGRVGKVTVAEISTATWPLSALCLFGLLRHSTSPQVIWLMYLALLLIAVSCYRVLSRWQTPYEISWRTAWSIALIVTVVFIIWTAIFQYRMYTRFLLGFDDLGLYYKRILNTIRYSSFHQIGSDKLPFQYHFGPGLILLVPLLAVWPTISVLIGVQSGFICGTAILLFILARKGGCSPLAALSICLCYLLYPAVTQQTYCYSYGFHPPSVSLPLVVVSFYFIEERRYLWATLIALLACSMQEHVCIYYFGMGSCWLMTKQYRVGVLCMLLSVTYFLLVTKFIMPKAPDHEGIAALKFWQPFGDSMSEIMLSPFTKPKIFFGSLANVHNLHLLIQLVLPMSFLCFLAPRFIIGLWPIFLFNALRSHLMSSSIAFQYQTITIGILFLACVMGVANKSMEGKLTSSVARIFGAQSPLKMSPNALLGSALATALFASTYLGLVPWARQNNLIIKPAEQQISNLQAFHDLRRLIPLDATVTADDRSLALFINHRLALFYGNTRGLETEYHVYQERYRNSRPEVVRDQVSRVLATGMYQLIYNKNGFYVLKRTVPLPPLPKHVF